mmetsp:Transcript_9119/g.18935  ORF Transcript_9119/g.18935 Transcript_9119/m.18935 type:complete len:215 (-) Transcript_9119:169-813(-)
MSRMTGHGNHLFRKTLGLNLGLQLFGKENVTKLADSIAQPIFHRLEPHGREQHVPQHRVDAQNSPAISGMVHFGRVKDGASQGMSSRRMVHHTRLSLGLDHFVPQELGEHEMGQVIGLELNIKTIFGLDQGLGHDTSIVDQIVKTIVLFIKSLGKGFDGRQVHIVHGDIRIHLGLGMVPQDFLLGRLGLGGIATGQNHGAVLARQGRSRPKSSS